MDLLSPEELQNLPLPMIIKESISIPKHSPKTFSLITLTLIFPLSFAILAHSLLTHPLITQIKNPNSSSHSHSHTSQYTKLLTFQFFYLIFLFAFSLLCTAAVVFTVASLYTSKPVSFSSTLSAVPTVFKRLFVTYLWVSLTMVVQLLVLVFLILLFPIDVDDTHYHLLFQLSSVVIFVLLLLVQIYISAVWDLASVISVIEPVYGLSALKKSFELLKGRTGMAVAIVYWYLVIYLMINGLFGSIVIHGGDYYGVFTRIVVGGFLVGVLVIVNLVRLLIQSVFYYVCKSYHHQSIDKSALYEHLGGYVGEVLPLKISIQM